MDHRRALAGGVEVFHVARDVFIDLARSPPLGAGHPVHLCHLQVGERFPLWRQEPAQGDRISPQIRQAGLGNAAVGGQHLVLEAIELVG